MTTGTEIKPDSSTPAPKDKEPRRISRRDLLGGLGIGGAFFLGVKFEAPLIESWQPHTVSPDPTPDTPSPSQSQSIETTPSTSPEATTTPETGKPTKENITSEEFGKLSEAGQIAIVRNPVETLHDPEAFVKSNAQSLAIIYGNGLNTDEYFAFLQSGKGDGEDYLRLLQQKDLRLFRVIMPDVDPDWVEKQVAAVAVPALNMMAHQYPVYTGSEKGIDIIAAVKQLPPYKVSVEASLTKVPASPGEHYTIADIETRLTNNLDKGTLKILRSLGDYMLQMDTRGVEQWPDIHWDAKNRTVVTGRISGIVTSRNY